MGVCMTPDELIDPQQVYVVAPGNPNKSMMYYRLKQCGSLSTNALAWTHGYS